MVDTPASRAARTQQTAEAEGVARLAHLSTSELIARINRAPDFGYDDEAAELRARLKRNGQGWRWTRHEPQRVEIYTLATGMIASPGRESP